MKLVIDVPESKLPEVVQILINEGDLTKEKQRDILEAVLMQACESLDECEIVVDQYRLVLK